MSLQNQSLGEIACNIPGATRLFQKHNMDFCCGGKRSLQEEAQRKGLNVDELLVALDDLNAHNQDEKDWKNEDQNELIDHILVRFHARHREQVPELIRLAEKVEKVHADHAQCPKGLAAHLAIIKHNMLSHMQKEEQILFPMLKRGMFDMAYGPISVMEEEHVEHGVALEKMMELSHQLVLPEDACNTWRALYLGLSEFRGDLMEHIHLENNILFKTGSSESESCGSNCRCG